MRPLKLLEGRGFLPKKDPLLEVRRQGCIDFNAVMKDLPSYFGKPIITELATAAKELHHVDIDRIEPEEVMALHRDLAYAVNAYYHTLYDGENPLVLPKSLAVPFWNLAKKAEVKPTLCYFLYSSNNFWRPNPDGSLTLDNLRIIRRFVHGMDEEWFITVHVAIDAKLELALVNLVLAQHCLISQDWPSLTHSLEQTANTTLEAREVLAQMPNCCSPWIYYDFVRPQIMGFENIIFEGVNELGGQPLTYRTGETGAQNPFAQAYDAFYGVKHAPTEGFDFVQEMRHHMLPEHVQFIEALEQAPSIRNTVIQIGDQKMIEAFNQGLTNWYDMANDHFEFACQYIFERPTTDQGTGGTPAKIWLPQIRDERLKALIT